MMKPSYLVAWCRTAALVSHSPPLCFVARTHTCKHTLDMTSALLMGARPLLFPGIPAFSCQLCLVFFCCFIFPFSSYLFPGFILIFVNMLRGNPASTDRKVQEIWFDCFLFVVVARLFPLLATLW